MDVTEILSFGPFTLIPARRELLRDGVPIELRARALDLLLYLVEQAGRITGKDALIEHVWGGRVVEENNLTVQLSILRRALGTNTDGSPFIRTLPGRGYVFVAPVHRVHELSASGGDIPLARHVPDDQSPERKRRENGLPSPGVMSTSGTLPAEPLTAFFGRSTELADLRARLREHRLVVVTGIGGVGKTRLTLHLGARIAADYPDGVAFLDLALVNDPARVAEALAVALGAGASMDLTETAVILALRNRRGLLLLDNAEHLVTAVADVVSMILAECPTMSVLVTSRESLGIRGESLFHLLPLPVPSASGGITVEEAQRYDGVRLFIDRAAATVQGFSVDETRVEAMVEICRQLDGIALAIEMAVRRLQVLSVQQLAERLHERFNLLAAHGRDALPRQKTLRTLFDWSWEQLTPAERTLLQHMAVFTGTVSLRGIVALEAGADAEWEVLDRLTALVERSLVSTELDTAEPRYRLMQTTRQYALDKLPADARRELYQRHAAHMAAMFEAAEAEWPTAPGSVWVRQYGQDADNLRGALDWAFASGGDVSLALRLTAFSYPLWWELPELPLREARRWFDLALSRLTSDTPQFVAARLWLGFAWKDTRLSDTENASAALRAADLFRATKESAGLGGSLWRAGSALLTKETLATARALFDEAEEVLRGLPRTKWLGLVMARRGDILARSGELEPALAAFEEGVTISRALQHRHGIATGSSNMSELLFHFGERDRALRQLRQLREELPTGIRVGSVATLAAHLLLAGHCVEAQDAVREVASSAPASGQMGALAWCAELLALMLVQATNVEAAAPLAGYARFVHPSVETRFGSRREVFLKLDAALAAELPADRRAALEKQGASWTEAEATESIKAFLSTLANVRNN